MLKIKETEPHYVEIGDLFDLYDQTYIRAKNAVVEVTRLGSSVLYDFPKCFFSQIPISEKSQGSMHLFVFNGELFAKISPNYAVKLSNGDVFSVDKDEICEVVCGKLIEIHETGEKKHITEIKAGELSQGYSFDPCLMLDRGDVEFNLSNGMYREAHQLTEERKMLDATLEYYRIKMLYKGCSVFKKD